MSTSVYGRIVRMTAQTTGEVDSWEIAKKKVTAVGTIPRAFTQVVRALTDDHFKFKGALRPVNKYQIARFLKTPSFKSIIYYISDTTIRHKLPKGAWTMGMIMNSFGPLDLAGFITSFVLYRRCKKLLPKEQWNILEPYIRNESLLATSVGYTIPEIGLGAGVLSAMLPVFSRITLAINGGAHAEHYVSLITTEKDSKIIEKFEATHFGCTATQISIMLLAAISFHSDFGMAYDQAFDLKKEFHSLQNDLSMRLRMASIWISSLKEGKTQPEMKIPAKFYPNEEDKPRLFGQLEKIRAGSQSWIERNQKEVSKELTPEYFEKLKGAEEIPEQLQDVFSLEEICAMEEEEFDDLIDQIDAESKAGKRKDILDTQDLATLEESI